MRNLIHRVLESFSWGASAFPVVDQREAPPVPPPTRRLRNLEQKLELQTRQLAEARDMLQQSAHLAHYHQPSLERQIRVWLAETSMASGPALGLKWWPPEDGDLLRRRGPAPDELTA